MASASAGGTCDDREASQPPQKVTHGIKDSIVLKSLAAGAVAGWAVDVALFPLDSLKTRLQSKGGCAQAGNFKKLYSGLPIVMLGNSIGSALFFASYEEVRACLGEPDGRCGTVLRDSVSAALGELVACVFRTPTEILKQRMQALHVDGITEGLRSIGRRDLSFGFRATAVRDLVFSAVQYPAYEYLKVLVTRDGRQLCPWESALCGSITGCCTAVLTTPLDVLKTRVMLDPGACSVGSLVSQIRHLYRAEGFRGFFHGAACRGAWMGLGGLLFLGSYEKAKTLIEDGAADQLLVHNFAGRYAWGKPADGAPSGASREDGVAFRRCWVLSPAGGEKEKKDFAALRDALKPGGVGASTAAVGDPTAPSSATPVRRSSEPTRTSCSPSTVQEKAPLQASSRLLQGVGLELVSGGIAGLAVDVTLHPVDTLKTRLQAASGFWGAGGFSRLWQGVSAPALTGIPASAVFWAVYEPSKARLRAAHLSNTQAEVVSATASEVTSLLVRVPSEVLKQRMQAGIHIGGLTDLVRSVVQREGLSGLYVGFIATCYRDVPWALIQFPVYEELKRRMDAWNSGRGSAALGAWWIGGLSGAAAGGIAAVATTPLDVVKTRIMLAPPGQRLSFSRMVQSIVAERGASALFAGVVPRSVYLSLGGMVYLGVYNGVSDSLRDWA